MEIQVAKAGLTRLMAPTEDTTELGFKVGPGATIIAKRRELHELKMEERSDRPQQKSSFQNCPINAPDLHQSASPSSQTIASHKAALLAKYVQRRTEPSSTHFEGRTEELPPNDKPQMMALGPQQREVISELIERGEKLRNAMVLSVLKSGKDQRVRSAKEPQTIKTQQDHCEVYSSEDENEKEEFSMDESDYPLHNPSLLEQLLYCVSDLSENELAIYIIISFDSLKECLYFKFDLRNLAASTHVLQDYASSGVPACTKYSALFFFLIA